MPADLLLLNIATHTAGMVSHYQPCLLMWCLTINHATWCGALLLVVPADVVLHYRSCLLVWYLTISYACWCGASLYRPCLLVWCLTTGHAFWCGASLQNVTVGVVPHYRPCLLVRWHCNQHFTIRVRVEEGWLQFCCYYYRGAITSDMAADPVSLSDMPACTFNSIRHACWVHLFRYVCVFVKSFSIRQEIWYVTNPPDMPTGKVPLPRVCKTCQLPSWTPS